MDYGKKDEKYEKEDRSNCNVFDVYFHNEETRVTILRRGKGSFTFKQPESGKDGANAELIYFIESDDVKIVKQRKGQDVYILA